MKKDRRFHEVSKVMTATTSNNKFYVSFTSDKVYRLRKDRGTPPRNGGYQPHMRTVDK